MNLTGRSTTGLIALFVCVLASCARTPDAAYGRGGQAIWIDTAGGRLKAEAFSAAQVSAHPVLLVVLHGDLPDPTPSYQYAFAEVVTRGVDAPALPDAVRARLAGWEPLQDLVVVGVLRPGYTDNAGDRSGGDMGRATGDNYTPEVVDAVAQATNSLEKRYSARRVILVGHSGGAAIAANLLGRHPEVADGALLVGCACDPEGMRARMRETRGSSIWKGSTRSLQPLDLAAHVRPDVIVRLIVGENDDVVLPEPSVRYADMLKQRGVDVQVSIIPALGHNILLTKAVLIALANLVQAGR